jgi:hypothetical protein
VRVFYPKYSRAQVVRLIGEGVPYLQRSLPLTLVVLFGSYAKGTYTVASDIDLLVVYSGEKRDDAFAVTKKTIAVPGLEPHVYTEDEYSKLKTTIDKMIEGGVVLVPSGG